MASANIEMDNREQVNRQLKEKNPLIKSLLTVFPGGLDDPYLKSYSEDWFSEDVIGKALKNPYSLRYRAIMNTLVFAIILKLIHDYQLLMDFIHFMNNEKIKSYLDSLEPEVRPLQKVDGIKEKSIYDILDELQKEFEKYMNLLFGKYSDLIALSFEQHEQILDFLTTDVLDDIRDPNIKTEISKILSEYQDEIALLKKESDQGFFDPVTKQFDLEKMIKHNHQHRVLMKDVEKKIVNTLEKSNVAHDKEGLIKKVKDKFGEVHGEYEDLKIVHEKIQTETLKTDEDLRNKLASEFNDIEKKLDLSQSDLTMLADIIKNRQSKAASFDSLTRVESKLKNVANQLTATEQATIQEVLQKYINPLILETKYNDELNVSVQKNKNDTPHASSKKQEIKQQLSDQDQSIQALSNSNKNEHQNTVSKNHNQLRSQNFEDKFKAKMNNVNHSNDKQENLDSIFKDEMDFGEKVEIYNDFVEKCDSLSKQYKDIFNPNVDMLISEDVDTIEKVHSASVELLNTNSLPEEANKIVKDFVEIMSIKLNELQNDRSRSP